jgi:hypothetical protein
VPESHAPQSFIDSIPRNRMATIFWLLLGIVLGAAFLAFARAQPAAESRVLAIGLLVAAAIYVLFALNGAEPEWIAVEVGGVVLYGSLAWLGLRHSLLWLSAGWALHPVWDVGVHLIGSGAVFAPAWYALICVTFDLLVAAYIAFWLRRTPSAAGAV